MGNADLRQLAALTPVALDDVGGGVVAIDAHNWLYKYLTTTVRFTNAGVYTTEEGEEVANLVGIVQGLPKLLAADLTPVFVFDGGPTELKAEELAERREQREATEERLAAAREEGDAVEIARLESRTQRLTETIQHTTRELFDRLDVPWVDAPAEGEAQAAWMARNDDAIDYAGSDDYDTLLFGAPYTLRQLTSSGDAELMDFEQTLADTDLTWEQLVDVAILIGTDFNDGISGYGPTTAVDAVHEHGDLWGVFEAEDLHIDHADRIRQLFLDPAITRDYDLDLSITPDIDAAREYVTVDWEIPGEEVARGFERIVDATQQTGLDDWG
ncbi:MAG: flap endonuclease-1 [Halobacteriaceae archaeon]